MLFRAFRSTSIAMTIAIVAGCRGGDAAPSGAEDSADTVRVLSYNIHHGEGMDSVVDLERIADLIREVDPDLVTLQEVDSVTTRTGGVDQAAELGRLTGLEPVYGRFMPYRGGAYGMALLSRWPIIETTNHRLPDGEEPRTALSATVRSPVTGRPLRVVGTHFYRTAEERLAQARALAQMLTEDTIPTILAGDFNSTPDSGVMRYLARSWEVVAKGGDHLTFPSYGPEREIDHVLLRPRGRFETVAQRLLSEPVVSDHRPMVVELVYEP